MDKLTKLRRNVRGVATIELALAAPILATLVVGLIDMSSVYSRKMALEQGAHRAIEKIMQTTEDTTPDATVQQEAAVQANVPVANVGVDYTLYCDLVEVADYNLKCTATQKEARYIEVKVIDNFAPMFPFRFAGCDPDGTYHLSATAGMRIQ